ncbi:MAG: carboxypeptidase-like regulatory domain-containing protein, partial [Myxococcota bacterium]
LEPGERAATLRLSPGYTVAGNVTAQAEVLATFAAVRAHLGADARAPRAAQVSYGDASFRLEGLSSGTYDLLVAAPGRAPHAQVLRVDGDERANVTLNVGEHLEVQTPREGPHLDLVGWGADPTVPRIQWAERMPVEGDDDVHRHRFSDVVPGAALVRFAADTDVRTERLVAPGLHVLE